MTVAEIDVEGKGGTIIKVKSAALGGPDDETLAAGLLAIAGQGNIQTTTLRAFNAEEMRGVIGKAD